MTPYVLSKFTCYNTCEVGGLEDGGPMVCGPNGTLPCGCIIADLHRALLETHTVRPLENAYL